jgi:hypothetical protein
MVMTVIMGMGMCVIMWVLMGWINPINVLWYFDRRDI